MGEILWKPDKERVENSLMNKFLQHVRNKHDENISNYSEFHDWSVCFPGQFWIELIKYFDISYTGELEPACENTTFEKYTWFQNVKLNFAENLLSHKDHSSVALNFVHESGLKKELSYRELTILVSRMQKRLKEYIGKGDVLAAYMPNIPETVVSMLATSSLGGVFTSTSSDFGVEGVVDRFGQSKPKVLVTAAGYEYNGKYFDQRNKIIEIANALPFLEKIIVVDFLGKNPDINDIPKAEMWDEFLEEPDGELTFKSVRFYDPLYIMYSSGTTGKPKCIVHSVGGTLLQHVKEHGLHTNLTSDKNIFYFTTCGWMMWNWLVSALYFGATVTLYEGSPGFPSLNEFFSIIDREKINIFGTSPKFLRALEDSGYENNFRFDTLETIMSTGAPLLPEQFDFIYENIKEDLNISSICGGTDIIGCFMLGNPMLPVRRGEIQCLGLGMDVACYDTDGKAKIGIEGELVCRQSFPSRPIYFLNDENNEKIKEAYFNRFPGVWHHGDYITITENGGVEVFGRSDATLNPGGVRIGTSEIYRQTETLSYLADSLCVGRKREGDVEIILFVKMTSGEVLNDARIDEIKKLIKTGTTPRHVPKYIWAIGDIPYTRSGKKMELAVTRILDNKPLTNIEAVANPECLEEYKKFV